MKKYWIEKNICTPEGDLMPIGFYLMADRNTAIIEVPSDIYGDEEPLYTETTERDTFLATYEDGTPVHRDDGELIGTKFKDYAFRKDPDGTVYATSEGWTTEYTPDGESDTSLEHHRGKEITKGEAEYILSRYGWSICKRCGAIYPELGDCTRCYR